MSDYKIAYLREYDSKQCDIRFMLILKTSNGESLEKEIIGFAKITDRLSDLKKSIQEKVVELRENSMNKKNNENMYLVLPATANEIEIVFQKRNKPYQEDRILQDFIKNVGTNCLEEYVQVLGQKFCIALNAPFVRHLRLPSAIYAHFKVEPAKLNTHNMEKKSSKFIWSKSLDTIAWDKVGEGYQYEVKETDVGHYLKIFCIPYTQHKIRGPSVEAISEYKVELLSDFPRCPFEDRHVLTKQRLKGNKFRVVSYNVLADRYVDGIQFSYCPPKALGIHYRKQLIMKELKGYHPDIVCLQEVDHLHYDDYYKEELKKMGLKSFYKRKGNRIPEGLVCAFNHNKFKVLESKHLVLKSGIDRKLFSDVVNLLNLNEDVKKEFLQQNTSLQATVLQDQRTKNIVIVGNTHLYYHPDADHIRLLQAFMSAIFLNHIKSRLEKEYTKNSVATMFCGDFNSDFAKSLYGFMVSGTIDPNHKDCLKISSAGDAKIFHQFHLESASGTPKYTNYTENFKGCLDYIFIEKDKILVNNVIPVPTEAELHQYKGLPNEFFPSDHLALVVDLEISCK